MANELVHGTVGTTMTQTEFEAVGLHVCNSQATGDLIYGSSATQLTRLGIGSANNVLHVSGGVPAWTSEVTSLTLNTAVAKGTWTASGTWTIPAVTMGGNLTGSASYTLNSLGHIGIGVASSTTITLDIRETTTDASDSTLYGVFNIFTINKGTSAKTTGVNGTISSLGAGATNNQNWTNASNVISHLGRFIITAGATGTITAASIFRTIAPIDAMTVTTLNHLYIADATGAGTVTNQYGIYIESMTKGATLDYAIYCVGASVGIFAALPTTDPSVAGKWWANAGIVTVSAG